MTRSDSPAARPREISSRSAIDSRSGERIGSRAGGRFSRFTAPVDRVPRSRHLRKEPPQRRTRRDQFRNPFPLPSRQSLHKGLLDPTDSIEAHVAFTP
jgi:hypothetical protein